MPITRRLSSSSSAQTPAPSSATTSTGTTATNTPAAATASSCGDDETSSTGDDRRASTPTASSSPVAAVSRPSFLSRLSFPLPLRNRNRNVAEFYIKSYDPYKKYGAGDHVKGAVVLVVQKPMRITHLTVALTGYVRVLKDSSLKDKAHSSSLLQLLPKGESDRPQYHGNGLATLFQDEQVLSGDGPIKPGPYHFEFDLVFPTKGLPSSIDFERGAICYVVSATLTRPTAMAPTTSCDRRLILVEKLDIGLIPPPRPKHIYLEPISKRSRRKKSSGIDKAVLPAPEITDAASEAGSTSAVTDDSGRDRAGDQRTPDQSDIRSEVSGSSGRSVSTSGISRLDYVQSRQQLVDDKTITASVTLNKGGYLPGDTVSVKIAIQHIKHVKSMNGVVVTLYREGRINSSPPSSSFTDSISKEDKRRMEKEEMYPKSRTGLGGLSLSSTSSMSVFRKDLDQALAPLILNPQTLNSTVTLSLKLPDDAFPTIRGTPGDMIRFKYQVEVLIDLGGKLKSGLQRFGRSFQDNKIDTLQSRRGANIVETREIKQRVPSITQETIVGTDDSFRGRTQTRSTSRTLRFTDDEEDETSHEETHNDYGTPYVNGQPSSSYFTSQANAQRYPAGPSRSGHQHTPSSPPAPYQWHLSSAEAAPSYIPPPQVPDEQQMTDKERIRQAETRLLPSQPPAGPPSPSGPSGPEPETDDQDDIYDAETPRLRTARPTAPLADDTGAGPSAPAHDDIEAPIADENSEDKQEVERQRLMGEASAPPEMPEDVDRREDTTSRQDMSPEAEPSAPRLNADDEDFRGYGVGAGPFNTRERRRNPEQLPAYER